MKKEYNIPKIAYESFSLAQNIAANCELLQQNMAQGSCPVLIPDWGITYITDSTCSDTVPGGNDTLCYHAPSESYNVFSS